MALSRNISASMQTFARVLAPERVSPMTDSTMTPGRIGYEAFREVHDKGRPFPSPNWENVPEVVRNAWEAGSQAAAKAGGTQPADDGSTAKIADLTNQLAAANANAGNLSGQIDTLKTQLQAATSSFEIAKIDSEAALKRADAAEKALADLKAAQAQPAVPVAPVAPVTPATPEATAAPADPATPTT